MTGQEATGTSDKIKNSVVTQEITFLLWEWPSTATGCPESNWHCSGQLAL